MRLAETLDRWYTSARADAVASLVLALMVLALLRGVAFSAIAPFPASHAELETVTYSWTFATDFRPPTGVVQVPQPLTSLARGTSAGGPTAVTAALPTVPSLYHLVGSLLMLLTKFLAPVLGVFLQRVLNSILAAIIVWLAFEIMREIAPENRVMQVAVPLAVALHPQFGIASSSATPMMLYVFGFSALLLLAARLTDPGADLRRIGLLMAATAVLAVPVDRILVVGLAAAALTTSYLGIAQRYRAWRIAVRVAPWLAGMLFLWRSALNDVLSKTIPWLSGNPVLPSLREELSVSYVTLSALLKGFVTFPTSAVGWSNYPLNTFLLSAALAITVPGLLGLLTESIRFLTQKVRGQGGGSLPPPPGWMVKVAVVFAVMAVVLYVPLLPITAPLLSQDREPAVHAGELIDMVLPHLQALAVLGLVVLAVRYLSRNWARLRALFAPTDRRKSYLLGAMAMLTLYGALIYPPQRPELVDFSLVAVVPSMYFILRGLQVVWRPLSTSEKLVVGTFWVLVVPAGLRIITALVPAAADILGLQKTIPLMPLGFSAALALSFVWAGYRFMAEVKAVSQPVSGATENDAAPPTTGSP